MYCTLSRRNQEEEKVRWQCPPTTTDASEPEQLLYTERCGGSDFVLDYRTFIWDRQLPVAVWRVYRPDS